MGQMNRTSFAVDYSVNDLRRMITRPERYAPVNFYQDTPIHLVMNPEELPGEVFKKGSVSYGKDKNKVFFEIEGSNFGRIRLNGKILAQEASDPDHYDYLAVYIDTNITSALAHRIIASLWCKYPEDADVSKLEVHHITNNGYDNRPCNLLWVTPEEHAEIEVGIFRGAKRMPSDYKYI